MQFVLSSNYSLQREAKQAAAVPSVIAQHPDYTAAYLHAGNALVALGRRDDARAVWLKGVEACAAKGDTHARGELEAALAG